MPHAHQGHAGCLVRRSLTRLYALQLMRAAKAAGHPRDCIAAAIVVAAQSHAHQVRKLDGSPYVVHPLQVATLVCQWGGSLNDVLVAILHDVLEDTPHSAAEQAQQIAREFGEAVLRGVMALSQNPALPQRHIRRAEAQQRLLDSLPWAGPGLGACKLADRLHNTITAAHLSGTAWQELRQENRQFYIPLAQRLGAVGVAQGLTSLDGPTPPAPPAHFVDWALAHQSPWLSPV